MSRIDISELSLGWRNQSREERDKPLCAERGQRVPDAMHYRRRLEVICARGVKGALDDARQHSGRNAVTAHVSNEQRRPARLNGRVIVQVASECRTWRIAAADCKPVDHSLAVWQKTLLKCSCLGHLDLEALEVLAMLFPA